MDHLQQIPFSQVDITGGFWQQKQTLNRNVTIHAVHDRFTDTGRFRAFKFDWTPDSDIPKPHFFWDSDIAKWMESAAYILAKTPDAALQQTVEQVIDDIEAHQDKSGYSISTTPLWNRKTGFGSATTTSCTAWGT